MLASAESASAESASPVLYIGSSSHCCPKVLSLSFDRYGEALAAGSDVASIFDVKTGNRIRNLNHHTKDVTSVSFSCSRQYPYLLATGSKD